MTHTFPGRLLPGAIVEVRPWPHIQATLDASGALEGLPFMPEMAQYCGQRFVVSKRLERTCEETKGTMRRIQNVVFLGDLRCDGTGHGGCQKGCYFFWKEAWLRRAGGASVVRVGEDAKSSPDFPFPTRLSEGGYVCQSTELIQATSALSALDLGSYFRDLRARTYSLPELLGNVSGGAFSRLRCLSTATSCRVLQGQQSPTPTESLNLKPGEWVEVKSPQEIAATLDRKGKNRGLAFTVEMLPFCGGRYRVLRRLEQMIDDPSRRLIKLQNTVILAQAICDRCHLLRGGCPRGNYYFWREIWLRRVAADGAPPPDQAPRRDSGPSLEVMPVQCAAAVQENAVLPPDGSQIALVTESQSREWDALVARHPLGTIYHLSGWKRALEAAFPHIEARFLGLWGAPSGQLLGGMALYVVRSWLLGNRLVAAPYATFCDPLIRDAHELSLLRPSLTQLLEQESARKLIIKARTPLPGNDRLGFGAAPEHLHHYLPLVEDPEKLRKSFSRTNVRQWIQRAERAGLTVQRLPGEVAMNVFHPLFVNTRRRLGLLWLPRRFFGALQQYLGAERTSVFVAHKGQVPIAAVLTLHFRDTLTLEMLGETDMAQKTGAVQLVYWGAIQWACREGYKFVSFGRTDTSNVQLAHHKRCWGCVEESLTEYSCSDTASEPRKGSSGRGQWACRQIVRLLVRRSPASVGSALGALLYRHWA